MAAHSGHAGEGSARPRFEVADILRAYGEAYRARHALTPEQRKVMWAIEACRTEVLGGHVDVCADCGHVRPSYNSCRNRHCPKCQGLAQAEWLERRRQHILPVPYFHVVFTVPGDLRSIAQYNRRLVYDLLFRAASGTLLTLGRDAERLDAQLGVTAVLHTWKRDLQYHPHVHCIVTGGGLSMDGTRWVDAGGRYLFPVHVMGKLFRGKFLDALQRAHDDGRLALPPGELAAQGVFGHLLSKLYAKRWVVYAKRPFAGPEQVFSYLGRYTHRVGLSNKRILSVSDKAITIATRGDNIASMSPQAFIRRFLLHVLPDGFVKIRHYGLMASANVKGRLVTARQLLEARVHPAGPAADEPDALPEDWIARLLRLTGVDLRICPACGGGRMQMGHHPLPRGARPAAAARAPPARIDAP